VIEEMTSDGLRLTVCYPFPPGTCLAVEVETAGGTTRTMNVRVAASEDHSERMWRLRCEYLPLVSDSPFGAMPLQAQSV